MKKITKRILVLFISISIIISNTGIVFAADSDEILRVDIDVVSEVVERIKLNETVSESQEKVLVEEIEILDYYGFPIKSVIDISLEDDEIIYEMLLTDEIINTVRVEMKDEEVLFDIKEGEIHNTLIYKTNGTILLNDNVVEITVDTVVEQEEVVENLENTRFITLENNTMDVVPRTGGFQWYAENNAPSYLKSATYGAYTNTANVVNVNLNIALENITLSAIVSALTSSTTLVGGFIGFTMSCLHELRRYNESSTKVSHKIYTAKSSDSPRYLKRKTYVYAETNYQGGYTTCYSYGVLL